MKSTFYFFINNSLNLLTLFINYDKLCRSTGARTQIINAFGSERQWSGDI